MNAQLHLGYQRAADLRAEAARHRQARHAQVGRQAPARPALSLNLRALLVRLRLA